MNEAIGEIRSQGSKWFYDNLENLDLPTHHVKNLRQYIMEREFSGENGYNWSNRLPRILSEITGRNVKHFGNYNKEGLRHIRVDDATENDLEISNRYDLARSYFQVVNRSHKVEFYIRLRNTYCWESHTSGTFNTSLYLADFRFVGNKKKRMEIEFGVSDSRIKPLVEAFLQQLGIVYEETSITSLSFNLKESFPFELDQIVKFILLAPGRA